MIRIVMYMDGGKSPGGYRFTISSGCTAWKAFKTIKGLKYFMEAYGLKLDPSKTEIHDGRALGNGRWATGEFFPKKIDSYYFWEKSEVPADAKKYVAVVNAEYVDCYIVDKGSEVIVYKPNPNAKKVYKPYDYRAMAALIG